MTNPYAGEIDAQIASLKTRAEDAQRLLQQSSATLSSPDGAVTITVGPGGALTDLRFGQRVNNHRPEQLSALVMSLVAQAQRQVGEQVLAAFGGMVGPNSAAMGVLGQFLPTQEEPTPSQQAEPQRRRPPVDDDDYFNNPRGYLDDPL